jgi:hypothetical protein
MAAQGIAGGAVMTVSRSAYQIEAGVPVPAPMRHYTQYPFAEMKVGDSFMAPLRLLKSISSASVNWRKRTSCKAKFTARKISDKQCRCWRIA